MSKKFKTDAKSIERRKRVITYLEAQLKAGTKSYPKEIGGTIDATPALLTDKDKARIHKELETLQARV